jgi:hypothetical protein
MAERQPPSEWKGSTRGEAAWKEARERVASRNDEVRRSGKKQREADEQAREDLRRAAELKRQAAVVQRSRSR